MTEKSVVGRIHDRIFKLAEDCSRIRNNANLEPVAREEAATRWTTYMVALEIVGEEEARASDARPSGPDGSQAIGSASQEWCETCRDVHDPSSPHIGAIPSPESVTIPRALYDVYRQDSELLDQLQDEFPTVRQGTSSLTALRGALETAIGSWRAEADKDHHLATDDMTGGQWAYQTEAAARSKILKRCADELSTALAVSQLGMEVDRPRSKIDSGLCCMARHANAVPPWTCDCMCHKKPLTED